MNMKKWCLKVVGGLAVVVVLFNLVLLLAGAPTAVAAPPCDDPTPQPGTGPIREQIIEVGPDRDTPDKDWVVVTPDQLPYSLPPKMLERFDQGEVTIRVPPETLMQRQGCSLDEDLCDTPYQGSTTGEMHIGGITQYLKVYWRLGYHNNARWWDLYRHEMWWTRSNADWTVRRAQHKTHAWGLECDRPDWLRPFQSASGYWDPNWYNATTTYRYVVIDDYWDAIAPTVEEYVSEVSADVCHYGHYYDRAPTEVIFTTW